MNVICTPSGIAEPERPAQGMADMAKAGFENVLLDLSMCCPPAELKKVLKRGEDTDRRMESRRDGEVRIKDGLQEDRQQKDRQEEIRQEARQTEGLPPAGLRGGAKNLREAARRVSLSFPVAVAPYLPWETKKQEAQPQALEAGELLRKLTLESIEICGEAGCKYLIVRPLFTGIASGDEWKENREYYLGLSDAAREKGVTILLENQCRDVNGHLIRGICADASEAAEWIDRLNTEVGEERFGFCMDVGAYNLCGQNFREAAAELQSRVKAVLLRDCIGTQEASLLPFTAVYHGQPKTDWLYVIRGLREIGFDGELILDIKDTASAFSPLLRPQLLTLTKAVAEYFAWQIGLENLLKKYGSIVLFGAGRMCGNYMKCYGEKYPPLFTCDNNPAFWGTEVRGLKVKSPESLKELPEDCAVLICNIYYREIEAQLREMGIGNPIEYFNDEYLPFYSRGQ